MWREQQGWQPGANTIAYYPLNSSNTVNDLSGNNYNGTNSGVTFGDYSGVDCGYFNGSSYVSTPLIANNLSTWSLNVWIKTTQGKGTIYSRQYDGYGSSSITFGYYQLNSGWSSDGTDYIVYGKTQNSGGSFVSTNAITNNWTNIAIVGNGSGMALYINGQLSNSGSGDFTFDNWGNSTFSRIGNWGVTQYGPRYNLTGYLSNFIFENKNWTAQEISDYYDQTKSLYGIS